MRSLTHGTERGGRALRVTALLTLVVSVFAIPATASAAAGGGLKQLATKGCLTDEASTPTGCEDVRAMQGIGKPAISPNGEQVYVPAQTKDAIVVFDRNAGTGVLTQKSGANGCYTSNASVASADGCATVTGLTGAKAVAVSPAGDDLYVVTSAGSLVAYDIDGDGNLTFRNSSGFCGCDLNTVVVSPDGNNLYPAGPGGTYDGIVGIYARNTTNGGVAGFVGCYAGVQGSSICTQLAQMSQIGDAEITPDGNQILVTGGENFACCKWSVIAFDRAAGGGLTQTGTASRCVSGNSLANCQTRSGMSYPRGLAIADDGRSIHVAAYETLSTITRDPGTGNLTANASSKCAAYVGSGSSGCTEVAGFAEFGFQTGVAVTPDNANLYVGINQPNGSIWGFTRSGDGAFSLKPRPLGCAQLSGINSCRSLVGAVGNTAITAAPGSRHIYASGGNRLFSFELDRAPVCQNVGSNTAHNTSVTVRLSCSDPDGDVVTYEKLSDPPKGALGGVQGDAINYIPLTGSSGADSFSYRAVALGVPSDPATATVNVAGPTAPPAPPPSPPGLIASTVGNNWAAARTYTTVISLSAKRLPAGASVVVACKTKKKSQQKSRCPYKSKSFKAPAGKAQVNLAKQFRKKKLPIGTKITVTITAPGFIGKKFVYTIRKRAIPKLKLTCLTPGSSTKSVSCG